MKDFKYLRKGKISKFLQQVKGVLYYMSEKGVQRPNF
jgi:hypothetical protein